MSAVAAPGRNFSFQLDGDVARLRGELDASTSPDTKEQLLAALAPGRTLVVDLAGVGFLDSSGLAVLVATLRRARETGARLVLQDPQPRVHRVIESAHLVELFDVSGGPADVDEAAEQAGRRASRHTLTASEVEELQTLLLGYENLLRWGDLTPEQVTVALQGHEVADATDDLELAGRVRAVLLRLGVSPPAPSPTD
jgi:anti-anti-sigma factor